MTRMIKAEAKYKPVTPQAVRIDALTEAAVKDGLETMILSAANRVAEATKSNVLEGGVFSSGEADARSMYYNSVKVLSVQNFTRRKRPSGTIIPVALVTTAGAAWSANFIEYGSGGSPGLYPMTKAVFGVTT